VKNLYVALLLEYVIFHLRLLFFQFAKNLNPFASDKCLHHQQKGNNQLYVLYNACSLESQINLEINFLTSLTTLK
jgi:hypothetical protein